AESCTGGMVAERITNIPGASDTFIGGVVAYADVIKTAALKVPLETLQAHGSVSEETVRAMAEGAQRLFSTEASIAVTGIAGRGARRVSARPARPRALRRSTGLPVAVQPAARRPASVPPRRAAPHRGAPGLARPGIWRARDTALPRDAAQRSDHCRGGLLPVARTRVQGAGVDAGRRAGLAGPVADARHAVAPRSRAAQP